MTKADVMKAATSKATTCGTEIIYNVIFGTDLICNVRFGRFFIAKYVSIISMLPVNQYQPDQAIANGLI